MELLGRPKGIESIFNAVFKKRELHRKHLVLIHDPTAAFGGFPALKLSLAEHSKFFPGEASEVECLHERNIRY